MEAQGVDALQVTADHVKLYKRALLEACMERTTVARRLSVLRGTYRQLAAKGLIAWETAQDIAAIQAPPGVEKNTTPALTPKQAVALLEAIPADTLQGVRDFALNIWMNTATDNWPRRRLSDRVFPSGAAPHLQLRAESYQ